MYVRRARDVAVPSPAPRFIFLPMRIPRPCRLPSKFPAPRFASAPRARHYLQAVDIHGASSPRFHPHTQSNAHDSSRLRFVSCLPSRVGRRSPVAAHLPATARVHVLCTRTLVKGLGRGKGGSVVECSAWKPLEARVSCIHESP
jgi:hypothetical protein